MKKIKFLLILTAFTLLNANAQTDNKNVTIITSGSGKTIEESQQSALRSAIEQAFGAFISSKTEIFNDEVVADQMASVSSGNIQSYEILSQLELPDSAWAVTIKSIVSVDKLTSFVQSKGVEIEIKGGLFALNIKQQILNEQSEIQAIAEMVGLLHEPMQVSFDYTIQSGEPKSLDAESANWAIPLKVIATCNSNIDICANYFIKTLEALSLTTQEAENYKSLNKNVFPITLTYLNENKTFYLRKKQSLIILKSFVSHWETYIQLFSVNNGINDYHPNGGGDLWGLSELEDSDLKVISLPTAGKVVGVISWEDKLTLNQIEQLSGYSVKAEGVVSQYKQGGYLIYENKGYGLVMSIIDITETEWFGNGSSLDHDVFDVNKAKLECEKLDINGYSDWYLPSIEELQYIYAYCNRNRIGLYNFSPNRYYISRSTRPDNSDNYYLRNTNGQALLDVNSGKIRVQHDNRGGCVRALRRFGSWPGNNEKENIKSINTIENTKNCIINNTFRYSKNGEISELSFSDSNQTYRNYTKFNGMEIEAEGNWTVVKNGEIMINVTSLKRNGKQIKRSIEKATLYVKDCNTIHSETDTKTGLYAEFIKTK